MITLATNLNSESKMETNLIGTLEPHGQKFRLSFSCGRDPISGAYRRIRVGPFRRKGDALNAHEELNPFAAEGNWRDLVEYAEREVLEGNSVVKEPWGTSGWDPIDRPTFDTVEGVALGFVEWRKNNPWGKKDRWPPAASATVDNYKATIRAFDHPKILARFRIGQRSPERLTKREIDEWIRALHSGVSADLATRAADLIRQVLEWASSVQSLLPRNVASDVYGPGRGKEPEDWLVLWDSAGELRDAPVGAFTPDEIKRVLHAAYDDDYALGILAEACVRMARLGEAAALDEVSGFSISADGSHAEMHIEGGIRALDGGGFGQTPGKHIGSPHDIARRSIPIPVEFHRRVEEWKTSPDRRLRASLKRNPNGLLLLNQSGNPITASTWRRLPERIYGAAGFSGAEIRSRKLTANSLRHSGITAAVLNGEVPEFIAKNAGNSAEMIRRVYVRPSKKQLHEIALNLVDF